MNRPYIFHLQHEDSLTGKTQTFGSIGVKKNGKGLICAVTVMSPKDRQNGGFNGKVVHDVLCGRLAKYKTRPDVRGVFKATDQKDLFIKVQGYLVELMINRRSLYFDFQSHAYTKSREHAIRMIEEKVLGC